MSLTLSSLLDEYDNFLVLERGLSKLSRKAYRFDVTKYIDHAERDLGREPNIDDQHDQLIRSYLSFCQGEKELKAATVARIIASLRVFFLFCQRNKHIRLNPMARIQNPKRPKKLPVYLLDNELKRLLASPDRTDAFGARDYAIMVTLGYTGVRLRELVEIDMKSIDFDSGVIRIMGKGAKERDIPLNASTLEAIKGYLEFRRPAEGVDALFLNRFGRRLSGRSIENIVKKHVNLAGISKDNVSPHKLRHTFATLLHNQSVDLLEIKTLLGHQNLSTTQIYTHTNPSRLRAAVNKLDVISGS
jgi:integrase/recombinase XerC